ncbi:MAG: hypothetical protein JW724_02020, partial [Candidatus Altiarchaeota archaeon]|nr:hypothetical protein [Candidatus Altiarchaeota archaeon]
GSSVGVYVQNQLGGTPLYTQRNRNSTEPFKRGRGENRKTLQTNTYLCNKALFFMNGNHKIKD